MNHTDLQSVVAALTSLGCKPTSSGAGYTAFCPIHEADHNGHKPSLSVNPGDQQSIVLTCHAGCSYSAIMDAMGLKPEPLNGKRHIVATYSYHDAAGNVVSEKLRYDNKDFRQRWPDGIGGYVYKKPTAAPAVLYRLPDLIDGIASGSTVYFVEGEKDVDRLASMGLCATTNIEGAAKPNQKAKWRQEYNEQLAGAVRVILIPDNDDVGHAHMRHIATALQGKVADIRWLELPGLPAKGDVSDWFDHGGRLLDFMALVDQTPSLSAPTQAEPTKPSIWVRGSTLLKTEFADPDWILPDILPDSGLFLLSGKPKSGKSWLALALAMAVAQCGMFLNRTVAGGRVLYLALEDHPRRLKERMLKLQPDVAGDPDQLLESAFATEFPRLGAGAEQLLESALSAGGVRLVVVDTLQKIRAVGGADTQYASDYASISALKALADKHAVCVLVVHHTRKMEADDIHDSVSGTLGLTGAADGSLVLVRQRGDGAAMLAVTGRDMPDNEFGLRFENGLWTFAGSAEEVRASAEQNELITALRLYGSDGATVPMLARDLDKKQPNIKRLLYKLRDANRVRSRNTKPAPHWVICEGHAPTPCPKCKGTGKVGFELANGKCFRCNGTGQLSGSVVSEEEEGEREQEESSDESEKSTHTTHTTHTAHTAHTTHTRGNGGAVSGVSGSDMPKNESGVSGVSGVSLERPIPDNAGKVDDAYVPENGVSGVSGVSASSAGNGVAMGGNLESVEKSTGGNAGNGGNGGYGNSKIKADITQSPTATRILDCLAGDLAGMNDATVISATVGKAGAALAQATINALLQAGKITKINGRLVLA